MRRLLSAMVTAVAALAALPAEAQERTTLEIGYMPILPVSQLFVALEEGWTEEAGIDAELV